MMKLLELFSLASLIVAQTVYKDQDFFRLTVADDGRVEALINADDPNWMTVYRQFIELDRKTGELMIVFNVAKSTYPSITALKTESHIMGTTIGSGGISWEKSYNITSNPEGYVQSDMVLWYDRMRNEMVMIYEQSDYIEGLDIDAYDQTLWLLRRSSSEGEWTVREEILSELDNVHIQYQIQESLDVNDEGYAKEVMLPIHHLSEQYSLQNYQMIARTDRSLDPGGDWDTYRLNETEGGADGMFDASIIRAPGENKQGYQLIAFLRDARGYWVRRAVSQDDGKTWKDPIETSLPNPDQMSQALYLNSDMVMLIYNPSQSMSTEPSPGDRYSNCHHLAVALSADYGLTWQYSRMIEYAYDGLFNYPVGMQDPGCNNIYLTYSVQVDEIKGCQMLKECDVQTQNTQTYIKFTVITEKWVQNDFDYQYDTGDACLWRLSEDITATPTMKEYALNAQSGITEESATFVVLAVTLGVLVIGNFFWCYFLCIKPKTDLKYSELDPKSKEMKEYQTTK